MLMPMHVPAPMRISMQMNICILVRGSLCMHACPHEPCKATKEAAESTEAHGHVIEVGVLPAPESLPLCVAHARPQSTTQVHLAHKLLQHLPSRCRDQVARHCHAAAL
mmetsp:Transcript_79302/g.157683  ORF Transcript_79302/g.157683 Transcript_79302/m.157683 type:complete len:108 (-) Transcript_79302:107-430(-)